MERLHCEAALFMKGENPMTKDMILMREKTRRAVANITLIAVMLSAFASAGAGRAYAADGTITLKVGRVIDYSSHFTHSCTDNQDTKAKCRGKTHRRCHGEHNA